MTKPIYQVSLYLDKTAQTIILSRSFVKEGEKENLEKLTGGFIDRSMLDLLEKEFIKFDQHLSDLFKTL